MILSLPFPKTDTGLLQWSQNVVDLITPTPADWGLVVGDVTTYTALHDGYATSLAANNPTVRSKTTVVNKNNAMAALKNGAIVIANKIYASPIVTTGMKTEIGMPPRQSPSPIPVPASAPVLEVISCNDWTVRIRLRAATGSPRGRLPGTTGATVLSYVGATPPTDISEWKFEGNCGRVNKIDVIFSNSLPAGTRVWLTAFWFNGRKQSGSACDPVGANLLGGGVSGSSTPTGT